MGFFDFFRRKKEKPAEQKLEPVKDNRTDRPFEQKPEDFSKKRDVQQGKGTQNTREGFYRKKRATSNRKRSGGNVNESVTQAPTARPTHQIRKQNHQRPAKRHYDPVKVENNSVRNYTVKAGDSLSRIAKDFYGDANEWQKIYQANKGRIKDPNIIHAGQVLIIP
jgi:nucleoid-associated protein YgaU